MSRRTFKTGLWDSITGGEKRQEQKKPHDEDETHESDRTRNEHIAEAYHYDALSGDALSMRLLLLHPGTRQEDISLRLYETHLDECAGSYEALSYVWGDLKEITPILVNGQTLEIGTNLRTALFNLRLLDKPRVLWVDAICIDQNNIDERNQQVATMGEIYRQASKTLVWLGIQGKMAAKAFSMLEDLADEAVSLAQAEGSSTSRVEQQDMSEINNMPRSMIEHEGVETPMFDRYNNDFSAVYVVGSTWWQRAWTVQEILLAPRATLVAERCSLDWDRLCVGGNHGLELGLWMPQMMGLILDPIVMPYLAIQSLRRKRRLRDSRGTPSQDLLDLLLRCRSRKATDPRDKIYSVLGLLADSGDPATSTSRDQSPPAAGPALLDIRPDYASATRTVYTHAAQQILLRSGSLDLLGACFSPTLVSDLPSWVPDWSVTEFTAVPLMNDAAGQPRATHAARHTAALPRFLDAGVTLALEAQEVTTLVALATPLPRIQFHSIEESDRVRGAGPMPEDRLAARLKRLGRMWRALSITYEVLMSVVPHLGTYAEWEAFAREVPPTNPSPGRAWSSKTSEPGTIGSLIRMTSHLSMATGSAADIEGGGDGEEEPDDALAVYWQTLCAGTYVEDASALAPNRGRKIATQQLFYSWRASLKPIRDLHRWKADRMLRPLGFVGYVRKTWGGYSEFIRFLECAYERRLGRGANGYICLVPATAEAGDKIVIARGGRVPLVVRRDDSSGCWRFVGEAYVQGVMDGQGWDESKCVELQVR